MSESHGQSERAGTDAERIAELEAAVQRLEGQVQRLLQRPPAARPPDRVPAASAPPAGPDGQAASDAPGVSRRQAVGKIVGAAAGLGIAAGAGVAAASPAAANNGQPIVLGSTANSATSPTGTAMVAENQNYGLGMTDNGFSGPFPTTGALFGHAKGTAFGTAGYLLGEGVAWGLHAKTEAGVAAQIESESAPSLVVYGNQDLGALIVSNGQPALAVTGDGVGVLVESFGTGPHAQLRSRLGLAMPAPPTTGVAHQAGDLTTDTDGPVAPSSYPTRESLWFCTNSGTPGTWRKLAGPGTAGSFHALPTPIRVYDSRPGTAPGVGSKTPLAANTARTLDLTVNNSKVPTGATAALVTILLVNAATGSGNFTVWANGAARPLSNSMVWGGSAGRFSSLAVSSLDALAKVQVQSSLQTDLVLDVVGYYR